MTDEDGYNGWSNRATWMANLHLSNERGMYEHCLELARADIDDVRAVASSLEQFCEGVLEACSRRDPMFADFLSVGTENIDWDEIARHWIADVQELDQ